MKFRIFRFVVFVCVLSILVTACAANPTESPTSTSDTAPVSQAGPNVYRVGYIAAGAYSPFFVAQEKGYFAEQGLQIEMESFRTGGEMIAPLSLGHLDIGAGELGPALFNAIAKDLDVRIVLPMSSTREGHGYVPLLVRKELFDQGEITTVADLKGRKIAVNATHGATEYLVAAVLKQIHLTVDDVELVVIPFPDMLQALANGAVDAAFMQYPLAGKAIQPGENGEPPVAAVLLKGEEVAGTIQNTFIYFGKNLLDPANEEDAVKIVTALLKACRDLTGEAWREDDTVVNAIVKYTKVTDAAARRGIVPYYDPNGAILLDSITGYQNYYLERGYPDYKDPLSIDSLIRDDFLAKALQTLGEYK